jgi:hypothetical protein
MAARLGSAGSITLLRVRPSLGLVNPLKYRRVVLRPESGGFPWGG